MDYLKTITITFDKKNIKDFDTFEQSLALLEENVMKHKELEIIINDTNITIGNTKYINNNSITFSNYINEGKLLKSFLIENGLTDENSYKNLFSIEKQKINTRDKKDVENLEQYIYKVPLNDKKILDIEEQLRKLKK